MVSFEDRIAKFHRISERLKSETQMASDDGYDRVGELDNELQKELNNIQYQDLPLQQLANRIEFLLELITDICKSESRSIEDYTAAIIQDVRTLQRAAIDKAN